MQPRPIFAARRPGWSAAAPRSAWRCAGSGGSAAATAARCSGEDGPGPPTPREVESAIPPALRARARAWR
eukprot:13789130-Alexandrium_andersonii.AAC.1